MSVFPNSTPLFSLRAPPPSPLFISQNFHFASLTAHRLTDRQISSYPLSHCVRVSSVEAYHGTMEAHHGTMEAHHGTMEAHHEAMEAYPWCCGLIIILTNRLRCRYHKVEVKLKCRHHKFNPALEDDRMM
jgi:hypothetical protein